ncbi:MULTISPECIES: transposase domain-containing protein [Streptomyces]|uniref:transposase domain-containing protein n=2 Tax=Streptomyces TaxID=1883 RepID=UPI0013148F9E
MNVDGMPSGSLQEFMPFGVLASEQSREAVDEVVVAHGRQPRRRDSRLSAHVMVYFALALGLWSGDDCEQVMARLTDRWSRPRLGSGVLADLYERLAEPITEILTPGAGSGRGGWWPWTAPWSTCTTPPPTTPTPVGLVAPPCRGRSLRPGSWQCLHRLIT